MRRFHAILGGLEARLAEEAQALLVSGGGEPEAELGAGLAHTLSSARKLESLKEALSLEAREAWDGLRQIHRERGRQVSH